MLLFVLSAYDILYHQRGLKYLYIRFLVKRLCLEKTFTITKKPLWKTSLMKEKSFHVENLLDEGKIFTCGKLSWWRKNICLWRTSFMKKKYLLVGNLLDEGKIFACGELPWWMKNLCLWKTSLMKENFLHERKIIFLWKTSFMKEKTFLLDNFLIKKISGKRRFKYCLVQEEILKTLVSFAEDKISMIFALVKMIVSRSMLNKY